MKVLGVVCHGIETTSAALAAQGFDYSVWPDKKGSVVVTITVEEMFLAYKALQGTDKQIAVLDMPTHFNGINLMFTGAKALPYGTYIKTKLRFPKVFPEFVIDKKLRAVQLTIKNVKKYLANKGKQ